MKQKQRITLFGMVAVALILAACDGDSGNNSSESEGDSSSSIEFSSSSEQINSSSVVKSSSSSVKISSSSVVVSSSGVKLQSSSSVAACSNTYETNTVKDCRDNQTYKIVVIGTQTWMAENLNYAVDSSWCYDSSADNCTKYGRFYQWASAMGLSATYNSTSASGVISTPQQGVCPAGWHIPTNGEWTTLENTVGGEEVAGRALKNTRGWEDDGNGTDAYGFSALPPGYRIYNGLFYNVGYSADFWSATENATGTAYYRDLDYYDANVYTCDNRKDYAFSVRCLKDAK
jgi:uncharacterized protein (TIGR02145 family)